MNILRTTLAAAAIAVFAIPSLSQDLIRHNYKYNGYTYIGTEKILVDAGDKHPFLADLECIGFPDSTFAYILEMNFISPVNKTASKGAPFSATTKDGKIMKAKQMYNETTDKRPFPDQNGKMVYWNKVQYLLEEGAIQKLADGVKNTDVAFSFEPDDYISSNYTDDQFGKVVKDLYYAIKSEKPADTELGENIENYSDQKGSLTVISKGLEATGAKAKYNISMTYMFFKEVHEEGYDLNFAVIPASGELNIPYESPVIFTLEDGSQVTLRQERDAINTVYCYPEPDQIKQILRGKVKSVSLKTQGGKTFTDEIAGNSFSDIVRIEYNSLQSVSVL